MKQVRIVLFDDLMNYLTITRSVEGADVFADILTTAYEYANGINSGAAAEDPSKVADRLYGKKDHYTAWVALRELIASINRGAEQRQRISDTNSANVGKRITGELEEIYSDKVDTDVISAVMDDARKNGQHPKEYAKAVLDRLIREGKTTLDAYQQDARSHERAKNPALNYQESDGLRDAIRNLGKDFYVNLDEE